MTLLSLLIEDCINKKNLDELDQTLSAVVMVLNGRKIIKYRVNIASTHCFKKLEEEQHKHHANSQLKPT